MAYFGRKPKKPQSVPGAASGGAEQDRAGTLRGVGRILSRGRTERASRAMRATRAERRQR